MQFSHSEQVLEINDNSCVYAVCTVRLHQLPICTSARGIMQMLANSRIDLSRFDHAHTLLIYFFIDLPDVLMTDSLRPEVTREYPQVFCKLWFRWL